MRAIRAPTGARCARTSAGSPFGKTFARFSAILPDVRFTFATVGTRGDVQPLLAVALELKRRGHDVALCAPSRFESWVHEHGVPFFAVGVDPEELLAAEKSPRRLRALMKADATRQFEVQ